jgi:outer membrane protein OmpA-like peptidoglycan-associated protein
MRILITGFALFVIWSFFSTWLYVDKILPSMNAQVTISTNPKSKTNETDSLARINALMPATMMIYFEFDKLKFEKNNQIDNNITELKSWLDKNQNSILLVTGNTDLVGASEYNFALGQKRAEIIKKYLVDKGIPSGRIEVESNGENKPIGDYLTDEGRAKNRRAEVSIKK